MKYHDAASQWFRAYGNEHREFDAQSLMQRSKASTGDEAISEAEHKFICTLQSIDELQSFK